jgi:hypothetical protein
VIGSGCGTFRGDRCYVAFGVSSLLAIQGNSSPDNSIADNEGRHLEEFGKPLPDKVDTVKAVSASLLSASFDGGTPAKVAGQLLNELFCVGR